MEYVYVKRKEREKEKERKRERGGKEHAIWTLDCPLQGFTPIFFFKINEHFVTIVAHESTRTHYM